MRKWQQTALLANLMVNVKVNITIFLKVILTERLFNFKFPEVDVVGAELKFICPTNYCQM